MFLNYRGTGMVSLPHSCDGCVPDIQTCRKYHNHCYWQRKISIIWSDSSPKGSRVTHLLWLARYEHQHFLMGQLSSLAQRNSSFAWGEEAVKVLITWRRPVMRQEFSKDASSLVVCKQKLAVMSYTLWHSAVHSRAKLGGVCCSLRHVILPSSAFWLAGYHEHAEYIVSVMRCIFGHYGNTLSLTKHLPTLPDPSSPSFSSSCLSYFRCQEWRHYNSNVVRCTYSHTHMCTYMHIHACTCTHMYTYTYTHTHACTCTHAYTYTCMYMYACIHTHTHTHAHTHTHTTFLT